MEKEEHLVNIKADNRERFAISKKLRNENRSNDLFEIMLNNLTIEEMLTLKLELVYRAIGSNLYGVPLWRSLEHIIKDCLINYALAVNPSKRKAAEYLGMSNKDFYTYLKSYRTRENYNDVWGKDPNQTWERK